MTITNFTAQFNVFANAEDGPDLGLDADVVALSGSVVFTALTGDDRLVLASDLSPAGAGFKFRSSSGWIGSDGRLRTGPNGTLNVRLWANDPVLELDKLIYRLDFNLSTPLGQKIPLRPAFFEAPSSDVVVNLASVLTFETPQPSYWVPLTSQRVADALSAAVPGFVTADLAAREIGFVDEGDGEGYFTVGGVQVSGTLVPPAAAWSGIAGIPDEIDLITDGPVLDGGSLVISEPNYHNGFPHMIRRSDGMLIAVWRRSGSHSAGRGSIRRSFSPDNGQTWYNAAGQTSTSSLDMVSDQIQQQSTSNDSRDACLAELSDGRIVLSYYLRHGSGGWYKDSNDLVLSEAARSAIRISDDGGLTFGPEIILPTGFTWNGHSAPVLELPDGQVLQPIFGSSTVDSPQAGGGTVVTYMQSTLDTMDSAEGWELAATPIYDGVDNWASECVLTLNKAQDGLIALVRIDELTETWTFHKPLSGGSWTKVSDRKGASSPRVLRTGSGRIFVPFRNEGVTRSALSWSDDDGVTWNGVQPNVLYLRENEASDWLYVYAGMAEVEPGRCVILYGIQFGGAADAPANLYTRTLATHPIHAPARLERAPIPWAPTSTVPTPTGLAVFYNPTLDLDRADAETLVRLADLSGNGRHIIPAGNAPEYDTDADGVKCLVFSSGDFLDIPALLGNSVFRTVVFAIKGENDATAVQQILTTKPATSSTEGWEVVWRPATDDPVRIRMNNAGHNNFSTPSVTFLQDVPFVAALSSDPAAPRGVLRGALVAGATSGIGYTSSSATVTRFGQSISGTSIPFVGSLYGLAIFERSMTVEQMNRATSWLAQQCGLSDDQFSAGS